MSRKASSSYCQRCESRRLVPFWVEDAALYKFCFCSFARYLRNCIKPCAKKFPFDAFVVFPVALCSSGTSVEVDIYNLRYEKCFSRLGVGFRCQFRVVTDIALAPDPESPGAIYSAGRCSAPHTIVCQPFLCNARMSCSVQESASLKNFWSDCKIPASKFRNGDSNSSSA